MKKYAMCLGNDINTIIGWNQNTDYYDAVTVDCLQEDSNGDFVEWLDTDVYEDLDSEDEIFEEEIWIYVEDTVEAIQEELIYAQREFNEILHIVELEQDGNAWYPVRIVE